LNIPNWESQNRGMYGKYMEDWKHYYYLFLRIWIYFVLVVHKRQSFSLRHQVPPLLWLANPVSWSTARATCDWTVDTSFTQPWWQPKQTMTWRHPGWWTNAIGWSPSRCCGSSECGSNSTEMQDMFTRSWFVNKWSFPSHSRFKLLSFVIPHKNGG